MTTYTCPAGRIPDHRPAETGVQRPDRTLPEPPSALAIERTVRAVRSWDSAQPGSFPFTEVATVLAAYGIAALPPELKSALAEAASLTVSPTASGTVTEGAFRPDGPEDGPADGSGGDDRIIAAWLTAAHAMCSGRQNYEAYTLYSLFDAHCAAAPEYDGPQHRARPLAALLTADLVRHELTATRSAARTAAVCRLTDDLARALGPTSGRTRQGPSSALRLAREVTAQLCVDGPPGLRILVTCPPLVTTAEADEYLFVRTVQIMEILASAAARHAEEATRRCHTRDLGDVSVSLRGIEECLTAATRLFPVLSTLDTGQFARIREATHGTGALQSPGFAALERACRGTDALRKETLAAIPLRRSPLPDTPLSELLSDLTTDTEAGTVPAAVPVAAAAHTVDRAWIRWKRAHRSVTRRVIGDVPGTGGSQGIAYLERHMHTPLLA